MVLQIKRRVEGIRREHWAAFGLVHGALDKAVVDSLAMWGPKCDLAHLRGSALCTTVRQLLLPSLVLNPTVRASSLWAVERPNVGLHLVDGANASIRVLRRPPGKVMAELPVTAPPVDTLFGKDYTAVGYEVAVLWTPDLKNKCLGRAVLAAIVEPENARRALIYAEVELPMAFAATVDPPELTDDADLDEWWDQEADVDSGDEGEAGGNPKLF